MKKNLIILVIIVIISISTKVLGQNSELNSENNHGDPTPVLKEDNFPDFDFSIFRYDGETMDVKITNSGNPGFVTMEIYDITGKKLIDRKIQLDNSECIYSIGSLGLPGGMYIMLFQNGQKKVSKKVYF